MAKKSEGSGKKKDGRDGTKNLIPLPNRSKEEQKEIRKKGGVASGEVRRQKRDMRILAKQLLEMEVPKSQESMRANMKALGYKEDDLVHANAILTAMLLQATNGDVNAAKFIRDTAGFTPDENINLNAEVSEKPDVIIYLPEIEKDEDEDDDEDGEV